MLLILMQCKLRKSSAFRANEKAMRREARLEMKKIGKENLLYTLEGFLKALTEFGYIINIQFYLCNYCFEIMTFQIITFTAIQLD